MYFKIKSAIGIFVIFICLLVSAEDEIIDTDTEIISKLIKLTVKKLCKTRKIRSKEEFPRTEGGIDYQKDDKTDFVSLNVSIYNKNKSSLKNYKISAVVYGESVTEKNTDPKVHSEFAEPINDLKSRGKFNKEFKCEMTYDKSDDTYEKELKDKNGEPIVNSFSQLPEVKKKVTPAFGTSFYGFKVDVLNEKGEVVVSYLWPGGLRKILEKAEKEKKITKKIKEKKDD